MDGGTVLALRPLTFLQEGDEVTVGCSAVGSYAVLPGDGAALLRRLGEGLTLDEAAAWYEHNYGEPVDAFSFAETVAELGFLRPAEEPSVSAGRSEPVRWQRLGRALFSPLALGCMAALITAWAVTVVRVPTLRPANHDIFFVHYLSIIELVLFFSQFPLMLIHESFHALAGRRLGLGSRLSVGRRMYYVVFETALDGLVAVPRRQRYLPMLAGLLADAVNVSLLTIVALLLLGPGDRMTLGSGVCLALAYSTLLRMLWQAYFHLETDLYYVIVTVYGCVNLRQVAREMLRNRVNRVLGRTDRLVDTERWHPRDRAVARWYSWLLPVGYFCSITAFALVAIPVGYRVLSNVFGRLVHPHGQSLAGLADSAVFLMLNLSQILIIAWLVRRERNKRRAARPLSQNAS